MARPTKLTKALIATAEEYLEDCTKFEDVVPTVAGLALALNISRETVYAWANAVEDDGKTLKHPEFSDTVSMVMTKQERELVANGLQSVFNPAITKLMLSANHNYKERVDTTTKDKEYPTPILNAIPSDNSSPEDPEAK